MDKTTVIDTKDGIAFARLAALRGALSLEAKGLRRSRGPTALSMLRSMGYHGNRATVLRKVEEEIERRIAAKR